MRHTSAPTFQATIYVAGDVRGAMAICSAYCDEVGLCVTVTPTTYVYTNGQESGVIVGLINYPRFPSAPAELRAAALDLAHRLRNGLLQRTCSVVFPDDTVWIHEGRPQRGDAETEKA